MDGDDDLDAIVRGTDDVTNTHHRYVNIGSASAPSYVAVTGTANPFTIAEVGGATALSLADVDGNGDVDLVAGANVGMIFLRDFIGAFRDGFESGDTSAWSNTVP